MAAQRSPSQKPDERTGVSADETRIPYWPRLMGVELASRYLGVSAGTFRALNIKSGSIGRRVVWDRIDLDRYADRLTDQPMTSIDRKVEASDIERKFLESRCA